MQFNPSARRFPTVARGGRSRSVLPGRSREGNRRGLREPVGECEAEKVDEVLGESGEVGEGNDRPIAGTRHPIDQRRQCSFQAAGGGKLDGAAHHLGTERRVQPLGCRERDRAMSAGGYDAVLVVSFGTYSPTVFSLLFPHSQLTT